MATATKEHGGGSVTSRLRTLLGRIRPLVADAATWATRDETWQNFSEAASTPGAVANAAAYAHGQVAARIGSHGLCDRYERHGPHLETTGIVDNGGNVVLHQCPGQYSDCRNCEDQKCMSCVLRDWHERCADDCPDCCGLPDEREEQVAELRSWIAALRGRIEALHHPDEHGPGRCDKPDCITSCRECGDDWPCATIRALAADEREEDRLRAALAEAATLRTQYRDLATYRTAHANLGLCPEGPDDEARDPDCPVCRVLVAHESGIRDRERAAFAALLDAEDDEE